MTQDYKTKEDNLYYFLIDDDVQIYGMLIAVYIKNLYLFQNSFLNKTIYNISSDNK